jgi:hypothetical protein
VTGERAAWRRRRSVAGDRAVRVRRHRRDDRPGENPHPIDAVPADAQARHLRLQHEFDHRAPHPEDAAVATDSERSVVAAAGALLVSFDHDGSVGGVDFDDDTVLAWSGSAWSIFFDASNEHAGFGAGDVVAVPEPGSLTGLLSGAALLLALSRRRAGRSLEDR